MASTRFRDDPLRKEEQIRQSVFAGDYQINAPGNGLTPDFMEDPHIRAQKWGANLMTNAVDVESDLFAIRQLNRDCAGKNEYTKYAPASSAMEYPSNSSMYTEQPRAVAPAWEIRDKEKTEVGQYLHLDPQHNLEMPFYNNINTHILEKDNFNPNLLRLELTNPAELMPKRSKPGNSK